MIRSHDLLLNVMRELGRTSVGEDPGRESLTGSIFGPSERPPLRIASWLDADEIAGDSLENVILEDLIDQAFASFDPD